MSVFGYESQEDLAKGVRPLLRVYFAKGVLFRWECLC